MARDVHYVAPHARSTGLRTSLRHAFKPLPPPPECKGACAHRETGRRGFIGRPQGYRILVKCDLLFSTHPLPSLLEDTACLALRPPSKGALR